MNEGQYYAALSEGLFSKCFMIESIQSTRQSLVNIVLSNAGISQDKNMKSKVFPILRLTAWDTRKMFKVYIGWIQVFLGPRLASAGSVKGALAKASQATA